VLARSRILAPVDSGDGDNSAVWSVTCLFVARPSRRRGLTIPLLQAAVAYAREQGARIVEGYPVEPHQPAMPPVFAATGIASAFRRAGFVEVLRRSETRPIMRCVL
jgi:GNAT superfamily N-acetyltransferase